MNNKIKDYPEFSEYLKEELKDPEFAVAYLNEAYATKDGVFFLRALHRVLEAHGSIKNLGKDPKLSSAPDLFESIGIKLEFKLA